jgi:hypothetical protein
MAIGVAIGVCDVVKREMVARHGLGGPPQITNHKSQITNEFGRLTR